MRLRLKSGLALGYETRGRGRVCVLLHPIAMSARFWRPVAERLHDNCRLLAIDLRGHGDSDTPGAAFTLEDMAADVVELVDALVGQPVTVVGCSMGGMVAQTVALQAPHLVERLVLTNTSFTLPPAAREVMRRRALDAREGMPALVEETLARWFSTGFRAARPEVVAEVRKLLLELDPTVHAWAWEAIGHLDLETQVETIGCPVLVASGSEDVSTPPSIARRHSELFPNARYVEAAGAGHFTPLEQPELFARWVRGFMRGEAAEPRL